MLYFPEIPFDLEQNIPFEKNSQYIARPADKTKPKSQMFTRFEFLERWTSEAAGQLLNAGLIKAFEEVQPEYRQWLRLDGSETAILGQMKPKGRYNINVAKRHDLKIEWGISDRSIDALNLTYQATASRANFHGRSRTYFAELAAVLAKHNVGDIVVVSKDEQPLSSLMIVFYDGVASYLYGGSAGDRSLMAPYLAHWAVIERAKKEKCQLYDLLAIAPPGNDNHPHAGLSRFKTQFGGESVRLLGSWDLVEQPFWYTMYRFIERRRRHTN